MNTIQEATSEAMLRHHEFKTQRHLQTLSEHGFAGNLTPDLLAANGIELTIQPSQGVEFLTQNNRRIGPLVEICPTLVVG